MNGHVHVCAYCIVNLNWSWSLSEMSMATLGLELILKCSCYQLMLEEKKAILVTLLVKIKNTHKISAKYCAGT